MDFKAFKQAVIDQAKAMGITEYELYYESGASTSVETFQKEINEFSAAQSGGVCFRCILNGRMGYASTEALDEEEARGIVVRAADNAAVLEADEPVFLCPGGQKYEDVEIKSYPMPTTEELKQVALELQSKLYEKDPSVIDGTSTAAFTEHSELAIVNSKGLDLFSVTDYAGLFGHPVVSDGKEMSDSYEVKVGELSTLDLQAVVDKSVGDAIRALGGDVPASGQMPVVFGYEAMASLLGVFSPIFSSENTQKKLSRLEGQEGQVIAAPCVTIVDDPFYEKGVVRRVFDAEGCPTHKKNVVENGVLNTLLYNMKTAAVAGRETTGNAAKAGYTGAVAVSPFTMYLNPGRYSEEEILAKAEGGVYIESLGGLHAGADSVSGDFSLQSTGFLIRDGKKADYVKSFTVAGNFFDVLKNITALGDRTVIRDGQRMGAPLTLVEGLSIAGK